MKLIRILISVAVSVATLVLLLLVADYMANHLWAVGVIIIIYGLVGLSYLFYKMMWG